MAYTLREAGVEESFGDGNQEVTRTFFVDPWTARAQFLNDIAGGVRSLAGVLYRQLPARDPDYPWLFARDVKFRPLTDDPGSLGSSISHITNRASYTTAVATVRYAPLDHEVADTTEKPSNEQQEIDLATIGWDFSARSLKLPNQWFVWCDDANGPANGLLANADTAVVKVYPGLQLVVTRHLVARKPHEAILGMLGRINKNDFYLQGDKYPKETMRFDSAKVTRKYTNRGAKFFEIAYTFAVQPMYDIVKDDATKAYVGWNRVFNPRNGYWQYVRNNTTHDKGIYEFDEDGPTQTFGGKVQSGFMLLFDPRAK